MKMRLAQKCQSLQAAEGVISHEMHIPGGIVYGTEALIAASEAHRKFDFGMM